VTQSPSNLAQDLLADWRVRAACAGYPNELFFPGGDPNPRVIDRVLAVCSICPVAADCLEYALETNQRSGIWGGTTEDERRSLRRKWLAARRRAG
jgi:WhiB family transcriptional regulator, redox-sensing transcriptional regulator